MTDVPERSVIVMTGGVPEGGVIVMTGCPREKC